MKHEISELTQLLETIISGCRNFDEIQVEISTLMESYSALWVDEICRPILLLLGRIEKEKQKDNKERQTQLIKAAINTLSYTELEVVLGIFNALKASEGILIAGKIADGLKVTRSVVVSALRKLESARIIETRSLGVKGTYINVLNPLFLAELQKLGINFQ